MKKSLCLFIGLLLPALSQADCLYYGQQDLDAESYKTCGEIHGNQITLLDEHRKNLIFEENGLSCIVDGGDAFYIKEDGGSRRVLMQDHYCDYFKNGLARGYENGKMVYIDKNLNVILKPEFEQLDSFQYEHAVVCNGPFEVVNDGEHKWMTKGQCGLINKKGKLVVDAKYPIGDSEAFANYINRHNHCPKPPIATKKSALCHAKRHLKEQETLTKIKKYCQLKKIMINGWLTFFTRIILTLRL